MHKPSVERLVYQYLYPKPKANDPVDFLDYARMYLVPEVRNETLRFYGAVACLESQYPGLDYSNRGHRLRLGQFRYHRRLFAAFDDLRLTPYEIDSLCRWEGTKWAKEKYEREHNAVIRDTTWDGIPACEPRKLPTVTRGIYMEGKGGGLIQTKTLYGQDASMSGMHAGDGTVDDESEQESTDGLAARSAARTFSRHRASTSAMYYQGGQADHDSAWEQWMKDATERGTIPSVSELGSSRHLAAYQAHIPAHYAFATPIYHYGPYSPATSTFTPTVSTYHPTYMPQPLQYSNHYPSQYSSNSYSARSSRNHRSRAFR